MPVAVLDQPVGSVTTMRDLTELTVLQRELGVSRQATDALRAQAHEFANRLHTISGLIEMGDYDEVLGYVKRLGRVTQRVASAVTDRVGDPSLAALLVAKASLAAERGIDLQIAEATRLGRVDEQLSEDLTTVVGNLVDNAFDALAATAGGSVEVGISKAGDAVLVTVRDSDPGWPQSSSTRCSSAASPPRSRGTVAAVSVSPSPGRSASAAAATSGSTTGAAALQAVPRLRPHLVLLDIYLLKPFDQAALRTRREQYAATAGSLATISTAAQPDIDRFFGNVRSHETERLPKGLSPETAALVRRVVQDAASDLSASECAELIGVSRVSARRYLQHLVDTGQAQVRLRYGAAGRPERRYAWR